MRFTILQDLKKMKQWWRGPAYNATTVTRMEKSGLIVGLFRWRKINEVYSEQNKLVLGGCL
ncbi:MAG: hypothetical protein ACLR6I_06285 [Waltera sp.]